MCGIVGYIGKRDVAPLLLEGLRAAGVPGLRLRGQVVNPPSPGR